MADPDDLDVAAYAASLAAAADVSPAAAAHLAALYEAACHAAFRLRCSRAQLEGFVGALARVVADDMAAWSRGARASFAAFSEALLALSVERPPRARGLLDPLQAAGAADFALRSYFQNHALFRLACAREPALELAQRTPSDVPPPARAPPLSAAVQVA